MSIFHIILIVIAILIITKVCFAIHDSITHEMTMPFVILYQKDGYVILDIVFLSLDRPMFFDIAMNSKLLMVFGTEPFISKEDAGEDAGRNLKEFNFEEMFPDYVFLDKIPEKVKHLSPIENFCLYKTYALNIKKLKLK